MVAVPASRSETPGSSAANCASCQRPLEGELAPHVCPGCGEPQPLSPLEGSDPFGILGAPRAFEQDLVALEKRFYALSRALHPDRFSIRGAASVQRSVERMSLLNQAYGELKSVDSRREALLRVEGIALENSKRAQMPVELAEGWFELQDALAESPEEARGKLSVFEQELAETRKGTDARIAGLEREWDRTRDRALLETLARELQGAAYLRSLERDVQRIRERVRA